MGEKIPFAKWHNPDFKIMLDCPTRKSIIRSVKFAYDKGLTEYKNKNWSIKNIGKICEYNTDFSCKSNTSEIEYRVTVFDNWWTGNKGVRVLLKTKKVE